MTRLPTPPMWQPPIAAPPQCPRYVIPGSHRLDPPYSWMVNKAVPSWWAARWPFPRQPWPFESCTRAPGTGLVTAMPCPPPPLPPQPCLYWPPGNRGC
jgi:hypothetical protein